MVDFNKCRKGPSVLCRKTFNPLDFDRRISCSDLGRGDCEGRLWLKKSSLLKSKFVRRWCVLKNYCLFFYLHTEDERAEGIIYVKDYRIAPIEDFKNRNFYFKIFNRNVTFTFATESQSSFSKWLNKLQISASGVSITEEEGPVCGFGTNYVRSNSSTLRSNETTTLYETENETDTDSVLVKYRNGSRRDSHDREAKTYSESENSDEESDKISDEIQEGTNNNFNESAIDNSGATEEFIENKRSSLKQKDKAMLAAESTELYESVRASKRNTEELDDMTMCAIKRIVEIERLLRDKRNLLQIIDDFLKKPTTSEYIREFWEEYREVIANPFPLQ